MTPAVAWRDISRAEGAMMAELAMTQNCIGSVMLKVRQGAARPYVVSAGVRCEGKRPWKVTKAYQILNRAVAAYGLLKEEATRRILSNS